MTDMTAPAPDRRVRLHVVNALVTANKQPAEQALTAAHRGWKPEPLAGVHRVYRPDNDEGEQIPPQSKKVQINVTRVLRDLTSVVGRELSLEWLQDNGNAVARADVIVDGVTVIAAAPVTYLLRLDKWLTNLRTFIDQLPALDPAVDWHYDLDRECWASDPVETFRTVKESTVLVKWAPPNEKFTQQAQTEVISVDKRAGVWFTTQLSGALKAERIREYRTRVTKLIDAVRVARETANATEIPDQTTVGPAVLAFLFDD